MWGRFGRQQVPSMIRSSLERLSGYFDSEVRLTSLWLVRMSLMSIVRMRYDLDEP
jgi:hypothetical protein